MVGPAAEKDVPRCRDLMRRTFRGEEHRPGVVAPFYVAYDQCDPLYAPEQYRIRTQRGKVVCALKLFVRRLHHPNGPVPVTIIGSVCTERRLRGRGLIKAVLEDSLAYSREIGARAQLIVTPKPGYYARHGYRYFKTVEWSGRLPDVTVRGARIEPLAPADDAGWVTDLHNAWSRGYGPIVRTEAYTRQWTLEMRLARPNCFGLKLLRRGRPAAYLCAWTELGRLRIVETAAVKRGEDMVALASALSRIGGGGFRAHMPDRHPFIAALRACGARPRRALEERTMAYPLDDAFPMPDETFYCSRFDHV